MKRILLLLIITFFNFSFLKAEIVEKVIINGNKRVSDETVIVYGDISLQKNTLK